MNWLAFVNKVDLGTSGNATTIRHYGAPGRRQFGFLLSNQNMGRKSRECIRRDDGGNCNSGKPIPH
jgi:hypothetical protein